MVGIQPKTVDGILASFQKTIDNLVSLIDRNDKAVTQKEIDIQGLRAEIQSTNNETNRAESVRDKLVDIIGI